MKRKSFNQGLRKNFFFLLIIISFAFLAERGNSRSRCLYSSDCSFSKIQRGEISRASSAPKTWRNRLPRVRNYIRQVMKKWDIPGLAVVIVDQNQIVMAEGYGWRDVAAKLPVTPQTRFILGSTSKAFTTLALGILVEEGKMTWDEPVRNHLPEFALKDELASLRCSARDLVTHRTGLPRHDLVWSGASLTPEQIVKVLRFLEPSQGFRSVYQYNNLMYITAGLLVERVAAQPWESFLQERIFKPLEMTHTGCSVADYLQSKEFALAYRRKGSKLEVIPWPSPEQVILYGPRASGSINSCAVDMGHWVIYHLQGEYKGQRLVSLAMLQEIHSPQIVRPLNQTDLPEIRYPSYGLGWAIDDYRGHYRVHHGGRTMGFTSFVFFFPEEHFGGAVLSNSSSPGASLVANYISDLGLDLTPIDWEKKLSIPTSPQEKHQPLSSAKVRPIRPLEEYRGEYINPAYGRIKIDYDDSTEMLFLSFHHRRITLIAINFDLFQPVEPSWKRYLVKFKTNFRGQIIALEIPFEPTVSPIVFEKIGVISKEKRKN